MNNGGAAFPVHIPGLDAGPTCNVGMSLRDYFASSAMQALLSVQLKNERSAESESIARAAFRMADAMLEGRGK